VVSLDEYLRWRGEFVALLDPALYPPAWLDQQVTAGEFILFAAPDAAILCSTRTYPSGLKEFHGQAGVGNLATIVSRLIPQAESYAKSIGCSYGSIASREGWSKVMQAHGYELYQTEIRKAL
jgi:hypothetical protein